MAQQSRKTPAPSEAMTRLLERPAISVSDWAVLNGVNRMTAAKAVAAGQVDGAYRVGGQTRIACAPWRAKFGFAPAAQTPDLGRAVA